MSVPNIEKLFQYFKAVAKYPIKYEGYLDSTGQYKLTKELKEYLENEPPIQSIKLNTSFFYNDTCLNCGGCDPAESNLFTKSEYEQIFSITDQEFIDYGLDPKALHDLRNGLYSMKHRINDEDIEVWVYNQNKNSLFLPTRNKELKRCSWCFKDSKNRFKCRIHPVESITCAMPHLKFYHTRKSPNTSMGIHQFGRNWALKCPVILSPPESEEQFEYNKQNRIEKLARLNQIGLDLNIDTYLTQIIEYIEPIKYDNYEDSLNINVLSNLKKSIPLF